MEEQRLNKFEYRLLRRTLGLGRKEVLWDWRKLQKEELNNFHSSANMITVITSRSVRLSEHAVRMRDMRNSYRI
jgi:hypothetical protein